MVDLVDALVQATVMQQPGGRGGGEDEGEGRTRGRGGAQLHKSIILIQWNLSIKDTLNKGYLFKEDCLQSQPQRTVSNLPLN